VKSSTGLIIGLCATAVFCCSGVGFFGYRTFTRARSTDGEADRFADAELPKITRDWSLAPVQADLAPEWKAQPQEIQDDWMKAMKVLLGSLKSAEPFTAASTFYRSNNGKSETYVEVRSKAVFEKAPGTVQMILVKRDGRWQIIKFFIASEVFRAPASGKKA